MLAAIIGMLQVSAPETLMVRAIERPPPPHVVPDSSRYGPPQVRIPTRQGTARVWLLRAMDTVFVAASIPDSTLHWRDDFVISLDIKGDGGPSPQHDDFQLEFSRLLDSSVVYRGRNGRWQPPQDDPEWRLKGGRSGGGWEVSDGNFRLGWSVLLRLDPVWLTGSEGRPARISFRVFDNDPQGFFVWPAPRDLTQPSAVETLPDQWAPVR